MSCCVFSSHGKHTDSGMIRPYARKSINELQELREKARSFAHFTAVIYNLSSTKETKWRQITCGCLPTMPLPNVTCCG